MKDDSQNSRIIIYQSDDGRTSVDVRFQGETTWLTQAQLVALFQSSKSNVSEHIKHIFEEKELDQDSVVRNFRTTAADGKTYEVECVAWAQALPYKISDISRPDPMSFCVA